MAMTMADDYYAADLDDVVHRLLPREILADVGIAPRSCALSCRSDDHAALVEDLAAHLVGILGLDGGRKKRAHAHPPYVRHEQGPRVRDGMDCGRRALVGGGQDGAGRHAPPPSWNNGAVPRRLPRFEPTVPVPAFADCHPSARRHGSGTGTGTGVFLPRAEAYLKNGASSTSLSPRNGAKPPRMLRKEALIIAMREQQEQLMQLRVMAEEMERQREAFPVAFQGCPALAAPRQWTY
ncbi:hypothetical protein D1007_25580 [Hordeum vulgare]|nr:hypothetical protein D1007_25580 [Hordeum vulgare]KAI4997170.1 hypothetical protein ZWY2020_052512 [Hordeum vulgare]